MKLRPLHDRVVVRRTEEERKSPGGIVIPDTATEKPSKGEVVAVGKGKILESGEIRPLDLKKGDKILFGKYSGTEVKVDGEDLLVMREDDVMAVIVERAGASVGFEALIRYCEQRLAYFAVPRYLETAEALPLTPSGKVQKYVLRERGVTVNTWDREAAGVTVRR